MRQRTKLEGKSRHILRAEATNLRLTKTPMRRRWGGGKGAGSGITRGVEGKEEGVMQHARKGGWGRRQVWGATCVRRAWAMLALSLPD